MTFQYWVDSDHYAFRLPADVADEDLIFCHDVEVFRYDTLDWAPYGDIVSELRNGEIDQVSKAEAERVCDVIRARVAARPTAAL